MWRISVVVVFLLGHLTLNKNIRSEDYFDASSLPTRTFRAG
jgi:polyisoprenoid-binding protein YceI